MLYYSDLRICVCGHAEFNHNKLGCKDQIPNNKGITHTSNLTMRKCPCNCFDVAYDGRLENPHIKPFGAMY